MNWKSVIYVLFFIYIFYQLIQDSGYDTISLEELKNRLNNTMKNITELNFEDVVNN